MEGIVNNMYYVLDSSWESRSWMFSPHTQKGSFVRWWQFWFCNILCNIHASNHQVIYNLNLHSVKCQLYFNKAGIQIKA